MIPRIDSVEDIDSIRDHSVAGITFRTSRLRSSLSSLYANYDFHLDMVKVMGVIVLLSVTSVTLAITNNLHVCESNKTQNATDCIRLTSHPVDTIKQYNSSICDYIQQFELPQDYKATVCLYQRENGGGTMSNNGKKPLTPGKTPSNYHQEIQSKIESAFDNLDIFANQSDNVVTFKNAHPPSYPVVDYDNDTTIP
ncbi:unnamed protein product [Mytilus coruscus]|uniref:Uncharacterized protein n=1 Tax=Mytilus coruscus TaxID=42192 RepID=A0A6J8B725_MYTCO|nr:unnamed protein product [Mytilus coruscus]